MSDFTQSDVDERETLAELISGFIEKTDDPSDLPKTRGLAEQILAGFRRSEAVIDDETDAVWQAIADALGGFGQVLNSHDETAEWVQRYLFRRPAEPQGEPSDALGRVEACIEGGLSDPPIPGDAYQTGFQNACRVIRNALRDKPRVPGAHSGEARIEPSDAQTIRDAAHRLLGDVNPKHRPALTSLMSEDVRIVATAALRAAAEAGGEGR